MFRNRTSSQKPGDELLSHFKANFGNVVGATASTAPTTQTSAGAAVNPANLDSNLRSQDDIKDLDPTPRAQHDAWRFTPSLLDPSTFTFGNFINQPTGYYTPTPGGINTVYHSQAGDLHTPGMGLGMGLGTPLSMPTTEANVHTGAMMQFSPYAHHMNQPHYQNFNPFSNNQPQHHQPQQQSYAPATFMHQDTGYETMDHDGSPPDEKFENSRMGSMDATMQHQSPLMSYQPRHYEMSANLLPPQAEKFRFHVVLNAPTAMVKSTDEIPVTYLNKGQAYSVSVVDTMPNVPLPPGTRYRTFVRVSFEDEQQRQKPATCWQLWKEGRGTNEAHQRGGKLQAVEYVEATQPADGDDKRTRVELDTASFDGFSVIWTPGVNGSTECNIAVRFNFLSTDFSHSKGVKGIPVRFCAKTEALNIGSPHPVHGSSEVAYCKVKLFRDHGAERKLSNDVQHVKKTIDKLKQQIAQSETGMKDFSKRSKQRQNSVAKPPQPAQRPGKVQKHKRTWSMSSASSAGGPRMPLEEDLHFKLQQQQDMFTSTKPVSILYLRGAEHDDPDLHPVQLPGEPWDLTKVESRDGPNWQQRTSGRSSGSTADTSSLVSPSPSTVSLHSQGMSMGNMPATAQWREFHSHGSDVLTSNPQQLASPPDQLTKIPKTDDTGGLSGWIEALGVEAGYRPPVEQPVRPVACFYIQCRDTNARDKPAYHKACYLGERSLKHLNNVIAAKWSFDPAHVLRTIHVTARGLEVEVDDDVVGQISEGQDIIMEVTKVAAPNAPTKREWEMVVDDDDEQAVESDNATTPQEGYEIRLIF